MTHDNTQNAIRTVRVDLAAAFRWAVRLDFHEGICNHFSVNLPGARRRFLINPHGLHWSEITASSLLLVDGDGRVVEGDGEIEPTARFIHWRIHRAAAQARATDRERAQAHCLMHTHMPWATAMGSLADKRLKFINQNAIKFYGRIAYDEAYNGVALDEAEGDRLAATLADKPVLMMGNHGVLVAAPSVAAAWSDLYYFERACRTYMMALATGRALDEIPSQLLARNAALIATEQDFAEPHFAALKRVLDREEPDYKS